MTPLRIPNRDARRLWLASQGLGPVPTGPLDLAGLVRSLGLVQLDSIQVVARAHHHILWSRNQNYREPMLYDLMRRERSIFEHFTHDASILPMDMLPWWQRQFVRRAERVLRAGWFRGMPDAEGRAALRARIAAEGPLSTHAFDTKIEGKREMWSRPPHKLGLDYMWFAGELATSHREGFVKHYDLAERVFPEHLRDQEHGEQAQVDWLCEAALERIWIGAPGEIQRFWDAVDAVEVRDWLERAKGQLVPVQVESAEGSWTAGWARGDIEVLLDATPPPTARLRILNPFDPAIRDRARLERLFGFDYRVEMFVPAAQRRWGYYVYPLLEGDRFVGRLEVKTDRARDALAVCRLWPEPGVKWSAARQGRLEAELARLARLAGVAGVVWDCVPELAAQG